MRFTADEKLLTIFPEGRIDSFNAAAAEKEILEILQAHPDRQVKLDLGQLTYISSAGLRVLLKVRKLRPGVTLIQVSPAIFDILDTTGFTELFRVERALRQLSLKGCPIIARGAKGTVYRLTPDTIVKVYRDGDPEDIRRERELARLAFVSGLPTAISFDMAMVDDRYASVFELLDAVSLSSAIRSEPNRLPEFVRMFTELLHQVHSTKANPDKVPDFRLRVLDKWLVRAQPFLSDEELQRLRQLVQALPEQNTLLHCDYHSNNVLLQDGELQLIDLDTLSRGHPVLELANIHICYVGFGLVEPTVV